MAVLLCAAAALMAVFMLRWTALRLDSMYFSAFEYAQAALLWGRISPLKRFLGFQHWLFRRYFDEWHIPLLALRALSFLLLPAQLLLWAAPRAGVAADAMYALLALALVLRWYLARVRGQDGRLYAVYNAFAPLRDEQRRMIRRQRNELRPTVLWQRLRLGEADSEEALAPEERSALAERCRRY